MGSLAIDLLEAFALALALERHVLSGLTVALVGAFPRQLRAAGPAVRTDRSMIDV